MFNFAGWAYRNFFAAAVANVLQPPVYRIYLRLRFVDPAGTVRNFPPNYPVRVRFGSGPGAIRVNSSPPNTGNGGVVAFDARSTSPWDNFTLEFDCPQVPYFVVEPLGSPPASPPQFHLASTLAAASAHGQRFFSLPRKWELNQVDWSPPPAFPVRGRWAAPPAAIQHTTSPPNDLSIGTPQSPIDFVLWPHWHYTRFEFYDRYFGSGDLDSPPRPAHRKRISIPQIGVEGFWNDPNSAGSPPDTHSNWAVDLGAKDLLQAVPFILRRSPPTVALSPPDGAHMGLRFRLPANSYVYSRTDLDRAIAVSPPPAKPGPDRLRYYDLPQLWKSRQYYTRRTVSSPPAAGTFFQTLTAAEITAAESQNQPLVFSLDDIVMTVGRPLGGGTLTGVLSPPSDITVSPPLGRVAIFNHRFDDRRAGIRSNPHGVYKLLTPPGPDAFDLPRSDVTPVNNYVFDYPDWTRLIASRGNLHDVFDRRTTEGLTSPPGVVGARAAVRWVDATAPFPGVTVDSWSPPGSVWVPEPDGLPIPGRLLSAVPSRVNVPTPVTNSLFSIQPFYQQRTAARQRSPFDITQDDEIGRYDVVLLRCCDVQSGNEVAVNLSYLRSSFDFTGPLSPPLGVSQAVYAQGISQNVANRWNGDDAGANQAYRAKLFPLSPPASPPIRVDVVWFPQSVRRSQAHFDVILWNDDRDNRGSQLGDGNSGIDSRQAQANGEYGAAHETGHMGGLPDEYNERWTAASYQQISMYQNLPGDPYEPDGRTEQNIFQPESAMMNGIQTLRNRYFWHNAEWVRPAIGVTLKVSLQHGSPPSVYGNYWLPQHAGTSRTYYGWPLRGRIDQAVSPPAASAPSPPVAYPQKWGRNDLYLYALGRDHYSSWTIDQMRATVASPFDAILVIAVKITCNLLPLPTAALAEADRERLLEEFANGARTIINNQWGFSGNVAGPAWTINKGLIHVVPQFVVENHSPPYDAATRSPADQLVPLSQSIQNNFGINLQLSMDTQSPPLVPTAIWSPPGRRLLLRGPVAGAGRMFAEHIPRMLGIPKSPPQLSPPDLEQIVRLILPGARVRRL